MKLPGTSADRPNTYPFDTPYDKIYQDLCNKDKKAYTQNGVLDMLDRNRRIKRNPEKFQTNYSPFDVILSCEGKFFVLFLELLKTLALQSSLSVKGQFSIFAVFLQNEYNISLNSQSIDKLSHIH